MYPELHASSAFSFLRGSSSPEDLVERASELGYQAMALADRDGLAGAPRFFKAAKKAGVRPIVGAEVSPGAEDGSSDGDFVTLLVENARGYRNLSRLLTARKKRNDESRLSPRFRGGDAARWGDDELSGLVALVGVRAGGVAHGGVMPAQAGIQAVVEGLLRVLGRENVFVEVERHLTRESQERARASIDCADSLGVPVLATNGVMHAKPAGRRLLDVFTCLRNHTTLSSAGRLLSENAERHLKRPRDMEALFADRKDAIRNAEALSDRLRFTLENLGYEFPSYPLPPGETNTSFLRAMTLQGARERYGARSKDDRARAMAQIEKELRVIEKLGLEGYFLIVWDLVQFCRREDILAQGRGSAANSAVCYSLGITAVDPVGMELLFERFLSEERGEWPDIDIDLPSGDRRERVIQHVYAKYGPHGAAMTANVITYREKSAAREMGKVLELPENVIDAVAAQMRRFEWTDPSDTFEARMLRTGLDLSGPLGPRLKVFARLFHDVQDLPRHLGQHSGGMVIAKGRLDEVVPLQPASMPGRTIVQWDKEDCADLGIIKVDLLGLGMMSALQDTIQILGARRVPIDLAQLPPDDPKTYAMMRAADTVGVFQIESRAQMATLPRMKPEKFYDLVVEVAIIRPGPIVGKMVHPYLNRRAGKEEIVYDHPLLEPILKRTLGVPLFQEQLLRMAMTVANFTGGEAEELRRAMGFKRSEKRMKELESRLRAGMIANGVSAEAQDRIVLSITSFALYGFPESHAASFALIAYASAYLRTHHNAAFTCALLNNQPMGFYQPLTLVKDSQRHGVRFLPIDVNRSGAMCSVVGRPAQLQLGLNYVNGLRGPAIESIVAARRDGAFTSIEDFARRTNLHADELERLASIGAFACFGETRREAMWQVAELGRAAGALFAHRSESVALEARGSVHEPDPPRAPPDDSHPIAAWESDGRRGEGPPTERSGVASTFEATGVGAPAKVPSRTPCDPRSEGGSPALVPDRTTERQHGICPLPEMTPLERLVTDIQGTDLSIGPHPVAFYRGLLNRRGVVPARDLASFEHDRPVRVAGAVICRQRPGTAKGFLFLTLEDETGLVNAIVKPKIFERYRDVLMRARLLEIDGIVQAKEGITVRAVAVRAVETEAPPPELPARNFC